MIYSGSRIKDTKFCRAIRTGHVGRLFSFSKQPALIDITFISVFEEGGSEYVSTE